MADVEDLRGVEHFEGLLKEKADKLVNVLAQGDIPAAMDQISELYEFRHQVFYQEVGMLTRGLHEALKAFGNDVQDSIQSDVSRVDLSDASQSLDHVVELTEKNAHQTMDKLDRALALVSELESEGLGDSAAEKLKALHTELTDVLVAQGYQDIAGQLIRKVMMLLSNVEQHLVQLMDMAAAVERLSGVRPSETDKPAVEDTKEKTIAAEGPQIRAKDSPDVVTEQDEVDELLSSLGF